MNFKNLKIKPGVLILTATISLSTLSGCVEKELAPQEEYDIVKEITIDNNGLSTTGLKQELEVPGETFTIITEYRRDNSEDRQWLVTADKFLYLTVYTKGLPDDTEVYIDNIHIDTSIVSKYASVNGIIQDTMDDRIHNSQMIGFPIGNDIRYYGVNAIEGCNQDFIKGTFYGYNGYSSGTIKEKRYTEADYRELKVYANKFQIVIDLLIKGPNDKDYRNVSINTDFIVEVSQEPIEYEKNGKVIVKEK